MEKGKVDSPWMGCSKQVLFIDYQNNEIARRILSTIYPNCVADLVVVVGDGVVVEGAAGAVALVPPQAGVGGRVREPRGLEARLHQVRVRGR